MSAPTTEARYRAGVHAIQKKMDAERPTLRAYLRKHCEMADKNARGWQEKYPGCEQAAYRSGMWYAYRDIERMLERNGFSDTEILTSHALRR